MPTISVPPAYTKHLMRARNATDQYSNPVPTGMRWIVRDIHISYLGVTSTAVTLSVNDGVTDFTITAPVFETLGNRTLSDVGCTVVLEEGERLHLTTSSEGVDALVGGYELAA